MEEKTNIVDDIKGLKIFNVIKQKSKIENNVVKVSFIDFTIKTENDKKFERRIELLKHIVDNEPLTADNFLDATPEISPIVYTTDITIFKSTKYSISNYIYNLIRSITSNNRNVINIRPKNNNETNYDYNEYTTKFIHYNINRYSSMDLRLFNSNSYVVMCGMKVLDLYNPDMFFIGKYNDNNLYYDPNIDDDLIIIANVEIQKSGLYFIYDDYNNYGLDKTEGYMNNITWIRIQ